MLDEGMAAFDNLYFYFYLSSLWKNAVKYGFFLSHRKITQV